MAMSSAYSSLQDAVSSVMTYAESNPWLKQSIDYTHDHPWIALGAALGAIVAWKFIRRPRNLPPGPWNLPLIGAVRYFSNEMDVKFLEDKPKYGDIIYFKAFGTALAIFNSEKLMREAFITRGSEFSDRRITFFNEAEGLGVDGIFSPTYNENYVAAKKLMVTGMKAFGFGTPKSETKINNNLDKLMDLYREEGGKPMATKISLRRFCTSTISAIFFNQDLPLNDPKVQDLSQLIINWCKFFNEGAVLLVFMLGGLSMIQQIFCRGMIANTKKATEDILAVLIGMIKEHKETYDPNEIRDIIDYYISQDHNFDERKTALNILAVLPDGVDSAANVLGWMHFYLAKNPDVQKKVQQEVDEVLGPNKHPSLSDKASMPYCECVIHETLRCADIFPINGFRVVKKDTDIGGYTLPNDTGVMANVHAVHYDPVLFPEPHQFRPSRFMRSDGKFNLDLSSHILTFGLGNRRCIGEMYIKIQLFMTLSHLAQKFNLTFDPSQPEPPSTKDPAKSIKHPMPHKLCFTSR